MVLAQAPDPRVTPAVKVIGEIQPAILPIFCQEGSGGVSGSGVLIHEQGYVLTADHVTRDRQGFVIFGLTRAPFKVVGRLPERDLALLKVDVPSTIAPVRLGRSHDLRPGEPIIVGGNPGGRGLVFSQGTINAPSIDPTWPNLLAKTFWRDDAADAALAKDMACSTGGRPQFIQFDAMSNKGNSGGALVNFLGELIGIVAQKAPGEDAVNWAIPIDRIRLFLPYFVQPEETRGFWTGLTIDPLAAGAVIEKVAASSPAVEAGLQPGDIIESVEGKPLRSGLDWLLALFGQNPAQPLALVVQRQGMKLEKSLPLASYPVPTAVPADSKKPGLNFTAYRGRIRAETGAKDLTAAEHGEVGTLTIDALAARLKNEFSVVFEGYIEFPQAGLHRLWLGSDDGARLFLDGQLVIDNGLSHPYSELSRAVRVPKGLLPVRIEYYQGGGEAKLTLALRAGNPADPAPALPLGLWRDAGEKH